MTTSLLLRILFCVSVVLIHLPSAFSADTLDPTFVDLVSRAMELAYQVQTQDESIVQGDFYIDGPHAALFSQQDEYCFLVFDSTKDTDWRDTWVNYDPFNRDICTINGECCNARNGFRRAYDDPYYKDLLEDQVRTCKQEGGEVVIVGHSQGGGIAPVGAVALADTEPTVIIFGAPGALNDECPPLFLQKYHHFTNTLVNDDGNLRYDHTASLNFRSQQYGNLYVMGDDPNNVVHYSHGEYPLNTVFDMLAHQRHRYENKVAALKATVDAGGSIGTNGWAIGYPCNKDSECIDSCVDGTCRKGVNEASCESNSDCESGRCEGMATRMVSGTCQDKLGPGGPCNEASDCLSNSCRLMPPWGRTCN